MLHFQEEGGKRSELDSKLKGVRENHMSFKKGE